MSRWARLAGWIAAVAAVFARPVLWPTALRLWWTLVPPAWWRRRPYLPVPDRRYLAFRLVTQYGDGASQVAARDLTRYLAWCRAMWSTSR